MPRHRATKLRKQAELMLASKENPGARQEARDDGIAVGLRVRYQAGGERYGIVRELKVRSVVIELSAAGMLPGGEDIIVREDEVPYADIREVLGPGRLAQPKPKEKVPLPMAPDRPQGYIHCDYDEDRISEVLIIKGRGPVALCKGHAAGPTDDEPAPFRFKLGLDLAPAYKRWPEPMPEQIAADQKSKLRRKRR